MINKAAIDRGLFRSIHYRVYKETESKIAGAEELFGKVTPDHPNYEAAHKIGIDGFVLKGVRVYDGDMIISKISPATTDDGQPIRPKCIFIKKGEEGVVDDVIVSINPDGTRTVKVKIAQHRIPEIGDKFAACPAQKGVAGILEDAENMPFTKDGIVMDILVNACSQASRMTTGQLKEIYTGKNCAVTGKFANTTIFQKKDMEEMGNELAALGYNRQGWEMVIDGKTGERLEALVYVGVCYYQRLKHMVQDKWHSRASKGPISALCRQPVDGRSREGGLRMGEMERDELISLGVSETLKQRLFHLSDYYKTTICADCGILCIGNEEKKIYVCKICKKNNVVWVEVPYALKYLITQLYAVHIALRIQVEK